MATDQAAAKKTLQALAKREDLGNKACVAVAVSSGDIGVSDFRHRLLLT